MKQINLLPWREEAKKRNTQDLIIRMIIFAALALILSFWISIMYKHAIRAEKKRNAYLTSVIGVEQQQLTKLINLKKDLVKLNHALNFVLSLQAKSFKTVKLLNALLRVVPENLTFNKIMRDNNTIVIIGRANSEAEISQLISNLGKYPIFKQPDLYEITRKDVTQGNVALFRLKVEQKDD